MHDIKIQMAALKKEKCQMTRGPHSHLYDNDEIVYMYYIPFSHQLWSSSHEVHYLWNITRESSPSRRTYRRRRIIHLNWSTSTPPKSFPFISIDLEDQSNLSTKIRITQHVYSHMHHSTSLVR